MDNNLNIAVGYWHRFEAYEIHDGFIQPAPGARMLPVDPWEHYRVEGDLSGKRMMETPYRSLFEIVERANGFELPAQKIIEWCSKFGLLGLVPHQTHKITLPARWARPKDDAVTLWKGLAGIDGDLPIPVVAIYVRLATGWRHTDKYIAPAHANCGHSRDDGALVSECCLPSDYPRPGIIWTRNANEAELQVDPLSILSESIRLPEYCPVPLSEPFWRAYRESAFHFMNAARQLFQCASILAELKGRSHSRLSDIELRRLHDQSNALNNLALGSNAAVTFGSGDTVTLAHKWAATSLLSSLALMLVFDLSEGRARRCANAGCTKVFVTGAWQGGYCSEKCRNTALKRRFRDAQKQASLLRQEGCTVREIANKLGKEISTVKGWLK